MRTFFFLSLIFTQAILCGCVSQRTLKSGLVYTYYRVSGVVSEDTILMDSVGRVKYIGVSVPRESLTGKRDRTFRQECKKENERLLLGKWCRFELDNEQEEPDKTMLAYVFVRLDGEEVFVNAYLIEQGLARFSPSTVNTKYNERLLTAEAIAKSKNRGIWSAPPPQ
jgi:endonuclease YncB( thermonuclease family)